MARKAEDQNLLKKKQVRNKTELATANFIQYKELSILKIDFLRI